MEKTDSKALFIEQVQSHASMLCELLACPTDTAVPVDLMERGLVNTKMLSGSMSLLQYRAWEEVLSGYARLLVRYSAGEETWDDRVAQVTSELIEREETLVNEYESEPSIDIDSVIHPSELRALVTEIHALEDEMDSPSEDNATASQPDVSGPTAPDLDAQVQEVLSNNAATSPPAQDTPSRSEAESETTPETDTSTRRPPEETDPEVPDVGSSELVAVDKRSVAGPRQTTPGPVDRAMPVDDAAKKKAVEPSLPTTTSVSRPAAGPLSRTVGGLQRTSFELIKLLTSDSWSDRDLTADEARELLREVALIRFHADALAQYAEERLQSAGFDAPIDFIKDALADFADEVNASDGDITLEVRFKSSGEVLDGELLRPIHRVLQKLIGDVVDRCSEPKLKVTVEAHIKDGALHWQVRDNGDYFISDSRLEPDDQLAFYPRLKDVRRLLRRLNGVFWLEPETGSRFEFTTPVSRSLDSVRIWGNGAGRFGVRTSQICELVKNQASLINNDAHGDYLTYDGRRVPVVRLDEIYREAPAAGDHVLVVGSLERRVAFCVPGLGEIRNGHPSSDPVLVWHGPRHDLVEMDGQRLPVIDADKVLEGYLNLTGALGAGEISGGALNNDSDDQSQAVESPPDVHSTAEDDDGIEVMVVEKSESMRSALRELFAHNYVKAAFATDVDEAVQMLDRMEPRLIISEFRMPSMAAKQIVGALRERGRDVPVLVTTSQSGDTAALLVQKLGASGYLSKPLQAEVASDLIRGYLDENVESE